MYSDVWRGFPIMISLVQVKNLAQREREATVTLIVHLAELDQRRLYLAEGYPSLFKYCTDVLRLSEHATYNRIETARAVRQFPVLLEPLAAGWVTLFAVRLLPPHLTPKNHRDVLALARHRSKREIEELIARLRRARHGVTTTVTSCLPSRRLRCRRCHASCAACATSGRQPTRP